MGCKNTPMYIYYIQNLNPVLFKYPVGMFKYSSEVIPTQTLQLNTMKVCLYVFETTIWKCLVLSRKQFFPYVKIIQADFSPPSITGWIWQTSVLCCKIWNIYVLCFHSQWLIRLIRECARIRKTCECICRSPVKCPGHSGGAGVTLQSGNPFTAPQPPETSAYIPTDYLQLADTRCRTEKNMHFVGRAGFSEGMRKDKRVNDITAFHCVVGHWKYFQAHFLNFFK